MLEALYNAIRKDAAPTIVKVGGRDYADKNLCPVKTPCPQPLIVSTLTALADYLNTNVDELERGKLICHVESHAQVDIRSALLGDFADRACYIRANIDQLEIPFNQWKDAETFNIILLSSWSGVRLPSGAPKKISRLCHNHSGVACFFCDQIATIARSKEGRL